MNLTLEIKYLKDENRKLKEENENQRKQLEKVIELYKNLKKELEVALKENVELKKEKEISNEKLEEMKDNLEKMTKKKKPNIKPNVEEKGKKRGRKKGHKGSTRSRPKKIDEIVIATYDKCPICGGELSELKETREKTVEDIEPKRSKKTTRIIEHRYKCKKCKKIVTAKGNLAPPKSRLGYKYILFVIYQNKVAALPVNKIVDELYHWFGFKVSSGTITNTIKKASVIFGDKYEQLLEDLRKEAYVNGDETGWRIDGENHWLWAFVSENISLYTIDKSRGHQVPLEILGEGFDGVLGSDFYPAYNPLPYKKQKCSVHLTRDTKSIADKKDATEEEKFLHETIKKIFRDAKEFDSKEHSNDEIKQAKERFLSRIDGLIQMGWKSEECKKIIKRLDRHRDSLFTFLEVKGMPSHNNAAERAIRPNVNTRKISGGNRSQWGAYAHGVLMSVTQTFKKQGLNFYDEGLRYMQEKYR